MGSVRRLARMLASPALTHSCAPPWQEVHHRDDDAGVLADVWLPPADLVLQNRGTDQGRLARLDSLGLVVRIKRPEEPAFYP